MGEIKLVMKQHEGFLLSLPKVIGVNVGYSRQHGAVVIKVYVDQEAFPEDLKRIPEELEGFKVKVEFMSM